jgi:hypothetical protein
MQCKKESAESEQPASDAMGAEPAADANHASVNLKSKAPVQCPGSPDSQAETESNSRDDFAEVVMQAKMVETAKSVNMTKTGEGR